MARYLFFISIIFLTSACHQKKDKSATLSNLKSAYQDAFNMGAAVNHDIVSGKDSLAQKVVLNHFNSITAENVMKAEIINPLPGVYSFEQADAYIDFGQKNNMFIIGHTLVWHNQCPDWFFKHENGELKSKEEVKTRLHDYIKAVASRYHGKVHAWDVVNEVIADDGSYRPTKWVEGVGDGDELVRLSFEYSAKYAPDTELYYNDFNAWRPTKRDGIIRMIKMLKAAGIRIDGVGMQGHWGLHFPENKYIEEAIVAYAAAGVKVMITELDIDVLPLTKEGQIIGTGMMHEQFQQEEFEKFLDPYKDGLLEEIENLQAERYQTLFDIFNKHKDKIDRVTLWGIHDGMSWKNDYPIPNRTNYPLLWDRNLKPKKALETLLKNR
ncbi:MAG: endo-1,4-beta-xylanase [Saprospiraceae bacterium]